MPRQLIAIAAVVLALVLGPPINSARAQPAAPGTPARPLGSPGAAPAAPAPDDGLFAPQESPSPASQGAAPAAPAPAGGLFAPQEPPSPASQGAAPAAVAPDGGPSAPQDPGPSPGSQGAGAPQDRTPSPASQGAPPAAAAPDGGLFAPPAADPAATSGATSPGLASDEVGDQAIAAELGLAAGGRATPGGLRVAGHYLYQLSERDWFDGTASFTFGSGRAGCFRDRSDALVCGHGLSDGAGAELSVNVRRLFVPQGAFRPFARAGAGLGIVRFGDDEVSGFSVVLHGGGGVRVKVAPSIAVVADGDLGLGFGSFSRGLGFEPQFSFVVTAGVEFRLR